MNQMYSLLVVVVTEFIKDHVLSIFAETKLKFTFLIVFCIFSLFSFNRCSSYTMMLSVTVVVCCHLKMLASERAQTRLTHVIL